MIASAPPAIITSASPRWMILSGIADRVVAGGAGGDHRGVRAPWRRSAWRPGPEAMLTMSIGMKNGRDAARAPCLSSVLVPLEERRMPPIPEPTSTPKRVASTCDESSPASSTRLHAARRCAYWMKRSSFLRVLLVDVLQRIEALDLAGDLASVAAWCRTG